MICLEWRQASDHLARLLSCLHSVPLECPSDATDGEACLRRTVRVSANAMFMNSQSVTAASEAKAVEFLFNESSFCELLGDALGISHWQPRFRIPRDSLGLSTGPGDIDALLVPEGNFRRAIAFECKRVKVQSDAFVDHGGVPNKLGNLPKALVQASKLVEAGFRQVFLMVVVQVDARRHPAQNWLTRGLRPDHVKTIRNAVDLTILHKYAGAIIVELTQPADKPIEDAGGIGVDMIRDASPQDQPRALTRSIHTLFAKGKRDNIEATRLKTPIFGVIDSIHEHE